MATGDVTGTVETAGVVGDAPPPYADTQFQASNRDTAGTLDASAVPPAYTDNRSPLSVDATHPAPDTEGVTGGVHTEHADDWDVAAGDMTGTVSTLEPGAPTSHADPAYRAPTAMVGALTGAGAVDTTHTDIPVSDGSDPDETLQYQSETKDTVNQTATLQTTTTNRPTAPAAPTVAATAPLTVTVTIVQVADPAGAKVTGYRVECARVATTKTPGVGDASDELAVGTDWAPRGTAVAPATTSVVFGTLVPSEIYVFRVAAINDNGSSDYSAWSAEVTPKPFDTVNIRYKPTSPTGDVAASTAISDPDPHYNPDGTVDGPNAPATVTADDTLVANELKVDWTAPPAKSPVVAVTGYKVILSNGAMVTLGVVLTYTFTGQAKVPTTATVIALSAKGAGLPRTSAAATPI